MEQNFVCRTVGGCKEKRKTRKKEIKKKRKKKRGTDPSRDLETKSIVGQIRAEISKVDIGNWH